MIYLDTKVFWQTVHTCEGRVPKKKKKDKKEEEEEGEEEAGRGNRRKKIEKQNKSVKTKLKSGIFLCFRTRIKFHPVSITTSFLHSNTKEIKSTFFFPQNMHFFLIIVILKFLNYSVWSMALEYQFFISVSSKYKKTKRLPLPFIVLWMGLDIKKQIYITSLNLQLLKHPQNSYIPFFFYWSDKLFCFHQFKRKHSKQ